MPFREIDDNSIGKPTSKFVDVNGIFDRENQIRNSALHCAKGEGIVPFLVEILHGDEFKLDWLCCFVLMNPLIDKSLKVTDDDGD